jgi:serine/threonine protein kinase
MTNILGMPTNMDLDDLNSSTSSDIVELEWYGTLVDDLYEDDEDDDSYQFCIKTMCHAVDYVSGLTVSCLISPSFLHDHEWSTSYDNNMIVFQLIHNAAMTENLLKYFESRLKGFKFCIHYDFPNIYLEDEDADILYFARQMCHHPMLSLPSNESKMRREESNSLERFRNNHQRYRHKTTNDDDDEEGEENEDEEELMGSYGSMVGIDLEFILRSSIDTHSEDPLLASDDIYEIVKRIRPIDERLHIFASDVYSLRSLENDLLPLIEQDKYICHQLTGGSGGGNEDGKGNDDDNDSVKYERYSKASKEALFEKLDNVYMNTKVKIVDLGNACWTHKHFTDDIQTRQYRAPEVIINAGYDTSADMWSLACIVFELLTGDLMFDPHSGKSWSREEDHLALMTELMGNFPKSLLAEGKLSSEYFNRNGELKHIHSLNYWGLKDVLYEKYKFSEQDAKEIADFIEPLLEVSLLFIFLFWSFIIYFSFVYFTD